MGDGVEVWVIKMDPSKTYEIPKCPKCRKEMSGRYENTGVEKFDLEVTPRYPQDLYWACLYCGYDDRKE